MNWQQQLKVNYPKDQKIEQIERLKAKLYQLELFPVTTAAEMKKPGTLEKWRKRKQAIRDKIRELEGKL